MSSPSLATSLRLAASGGRSDHVRIGITAAGAFMTTLLFFLAASVGLIGPTDGPYRFEVLNQPGLRPGVIISLLLLTVPTLIFVGQCSRFGAPARDRRLARLRMAGARPRDVVRIVAVETGLAAFGGSIVAAVAYFVGRRWFATEHIATITTETEIGSRGILLEEVNATVRYAPTDVLFPAWIVVALVAVVPVLATGFSVLALRRVVLSPFGVNRSTPSTPPRLLPVVLFGAGTAALMSFSAVVRLLDLDRRAFPLVALTGFIFFVMIATGLIIGGASIAAATGRFIAPRTDRPSILLAARRLIAAPYTSTRATTSILLAVFIGSAVQAVRASFLAGTDPEDTFYATTFSLLNLVLVAAIVLSCASLAITTTEAVVERRRTLAALKAAGTPRRTLAASLFAETLVPLVPSVVLAASAGLLSARGVFGSRVSSWSDERGEVILVDVPLPVATPALLGVCAIAVSVLATAASLVPLRRSFDHAELRTAA